MNLHPTLCDVAHVVNGKLYILGGGWTTISNGHPGYAIALTLEVPWNQLGGEHKLKCSLLDAKGKVAVNENGEPLIEAVADLSTQRQPGVLLGVPIVVPLVLPVPPVSLPAGRYAWRFFIDDHSELDWELGFNVVDVGPQRLAG